MVEASLADPVSDALLDNHLILLSLLVAIHRIVLILGILEYELSTLIRLFEILLHFVGHLAIHVLWLTLKIFRIFSFFASKAVLATLEVVVLALVAFPATIREVKARLWLLISLFSSFWDNYFLVIETLLMKRSDPTSKLGGLSEFSCLFLSWTKVDTVQWWEKQFVR